MAVTAKMKVEHIRAFEEGHPTEYRQITLRPVYSPDPASPNYSWSKWTPSGQLDMTITNPAAFHQFRLGATFLLTFEEVEA